MKSKINPTKLQIWRSLLQNTLNKTINPRSLGKEKKVGLKILILLLV
jgi:hypothetical protein